MSFAGSAGALITAPAPLDSALYKAGVDQDDRIVSIDGTPLSSPQALEQVLNRHKPGDAVAIKFVRRDGETVSATLVLEADPRIVIVPIEQGGGTLSPDQKTFRAGWLGSRVR
jgi:predicted metalloprotease with PDZ domain